MRVVVAVGGNALLERGEVPLAEIQERHVDVAVRALAPLAGSHDLVITHGNGPQVGLLSNESALDSALPHPYPLEVLGAQTQGMIGYFFLQALENALPGREVVSLICQTEVSADDPAFTDPTKFIGPIYTEEEGHRLAELRGWQVRPDGRSWRRVVASPEPRVIVELAAIRRLMADGAVVICVGGGGIPVVRGADGQLRGAEAVIDKDLGAALLARDLEADALLILTDVASVELEFGTRDVHPITRATPDELRSLSFPSGSMGPKVEAACRFVVSSGKPAMIGRLSEAAEILAGTCGTHVVPEHQRTPDAVLRADAEGCTCP
jgi:carbamate kinase